MTDKPKRGRPPKAESERRRNTINVRLDDAAHSNVERAASEAGRSLSGEIQHRLADYESLRGFVDRLLDDSVTINIAVGLKTLRSGAETTPPGFLTNEDTISLERAVFAAACIAKLFKTVAEHAGRALTAKREAMIASHWAQKIETGNLAGDFDIPATAAWFSADMTKHTTQEGERMALHMGSTIGPSIWDVCFDKDDPFRSALVGTGNVLAELWTGVSLPPSFMPPPQTAEKRMKYRRAIRPAAKHQIEKGLYPGKSEDEVVDILLDDLLESYGSNESEGPPDAKAS